MPSQAGQNYQMHAGLPLFPSLNTWNYMKQVFSFNKIYHHYFCAGEGLKLPYGPTAISCLQ